MRETDLAKMTQRHRVALKRLIVGFADTREVAVDDLAAAVERPDQGSAIWLKNPTASTCSRPPQARHGVDEGGQ